MDFENIQVAMRMRPLLEFEKNSGEKEIWNVNHRFLEV